MRRVGRRVEFWVLVVEDDAELRAEVGKLLEGMSLRYIEARSVAEAAAKLQNQRFNLVLLDLQLERGVPGSQVIEVMRDSPHNLNAATPIVVMSGYLDPATIAQIRAKVNAVLVKPFKPDDLRQKLQQVLDASVAAGGA